VDTDTYDRGPIYKVWSPTARLAYAKSLKNISALSSSLYGHGQGNADHDWMSDSRDPAFARAAMHLFFHASTDARLSVMGST